MTGSLKCVSKLVKIYNSMQRMTFDETSCCLKMYDFLCAKEKLSSHGKSLCKYTTKEKDLALRLVIF